MASSPSIDQPRRSGLCFCQLLLLRSALISFQASAVSATCFRDLRASMLELSLPVGSCEHEFLQLPHEAGTCRSPLVQVAASCCSGEMPQNKQVHGGVPSTGQISSQVPHLHPVSKSPSQGPHLIKRSNATSGVVAGCDCACMIHLHRLQHPKALAISGRYDAGDCTHGIASSTASKPRLSLMLAS